MNLPSERGIYGASRTAFRATLKRHECRAPVRWFIVPMRAFEIVATSMNLVAADVRRLILFWAKAVRASLRRLLRFMIPRRGSNLV